MKGIAPGAAMTLLAALAFAVPAGHARADGIIAHHGEIVETEKPGLPSQGFLEIDNSQNQPDMLIGATCPIAAAALLVGPSGTALPQLPVPAGSHILLRADGPHLLLRSPHFSIDAGSAVPCSLRFRHAGTIQIYLYAIPAP